MATRLSRWFLIGVASLLAVSLNSGAAATQNMNSTSQAGRVCINRTFQSGDSNANATDQSCRVNINRTIQTGGSSRNSTSQYGGTNRYGTTQRGGLGHAAFERGERNHGKSGRRDDKRRRRWGDK